MNELLVKEVFSEGFVRVSENNALSSFFLRFTEKMALVVMDKRGKYKGVIARRWIIKSCLDPSKTKVRSLVRRAPALSPQDSLSKVARLMLRSGVDCWAS